MRKFVKNLVSIVVPIYEGVQYVSQLLNSVLYQTWRDIELILLSDDSADQTVLTAESYCEKLTAKGYIYRIVHVRHKDASAAIHRGLSYVTGEYLIWSDSDMILEPESIKKRVEYLWNHPEYYCVRNLPYFFESESGEVLELNEGVGEVSKEKLFWEMLESRTYVYSGCYLLSSEKFFRIYQDCCLSEYDIGNLIPIFLPFMFYYRCPTLEEKLCGVRIRDDGDLGKRKESEEAYKEYEKLVDEAADICRLEDDSDQNRIMILKARRRYEIALKYRCKQRAAEAMRQLYKCGESSLFHLVKDLAWIYFGDTRAGSMYQTYQKLYRQISGKCEVDQVLFCKNRAVALSFDVAYGNTFTVQLMKKMSQHHIKATFFACGVWIERYFDDYLKILREGHEFGNHSFSHPHMDELTENEVKKEVERVQGILAQSPGEDKRLFRFPYGQSNKHLVKLIDQMGLFSISWSIDTKDWTGICAEKIYKNIMNSEELKEGAIILMHNNGIHTIEALDMIIPALKAKGYEIVRVSDLLKSVPIYRKKWNSKQYHGKTV